MKPWFQCVLTPWKSGFMASRALRALRHVNDELTRASEAIIRSARGPQPPLRVQPPVTDAAQRDTATERASQAA
jgi:hypothetical protein